MKRVRMPRRIPRLLSVVLFLLLPCLSFAGEPKPTADTIVTTPHYSLRAMDVIPNDPYYPSQWNLHKVGAPAAWDITTGSERVVIAFVDSGLDLEHSEFKGKIVDGWDFVNWDSEPQDDYGHGTFVASIAVAGTNNGLGMAGVSWGAKIMPIKVTDDQGVWYYWHAAGGITYAADHGAKIINLSWTLDSGIDPHPLQDAVNYAHSRGALVVAAAGDSHDDSYQYPAALDHVVSVAATTPDDEHPDFSTCNDKVDVAAPGVDILGIYRDAYGRYSSTDAAVPHVSGLAALIWSVNPTLTPDEVESIIESTAVDLGEPGWDACFGHGRIDANAAVRATPHYLQVEPDSLHFLVCDDSDPSLQKITNPGTNSSTWSVTATAPWLSINPPEGYYTPSSAMASIDISSLPDYGVYTTTIIATSTLTSCVNCPRTIPVTAIYTQCWRSYLPLLFKKP
jgi:subtilisin family serine protease